jgi:hypothetical protein
MAESKSSGRDSPCGNEETLFVKKSYFNIAGFMLVGDGLLTLFRPGRETLLEKRGPKPYRFLVGKVTRRPGLACTVGLLEIGIGLWLATRRRQRLRAF